MAAPVRVTASDGTAIRIFRTGKLTYGKECSSTNWQYPRYTGYGHMLTEGRTHGGAIRRGTTCGPRFTPRYPGVSRAGGLRNPHARGVCVAATHAGRTSPCGATATHPDLFLSHQRPER